MAVKTPVPPGPPPRGFKFPDQPAPGTVGPLGPGPTGSRTVVVQPGRHGVTVFVGIVALIVGLVFGFQLGQGSGDDTAGPLEESDNEIDAPTVSIPPPTSVAPGPPSTGEGEVSTEPLGSLANPIPVGQPWILGIWQLEVIKTDLDATGRITDASDRNPIPAEGSVFVLVEIELTLLDDVFVFAEDFLPALQTADGQEIANGFATCGPDVPDDFYDNGRLSVDEPTRGNLCFEVPADATDDLLLTTDGVGETTTYFELD